MRLSHTLLAIAALSLAFTTTAEAQYGATGVFYDYTQVTVGGRPQFVLMPRGTDAYSLDAPPQVSIPAAFRLLRDNKRATYGNASVTLSDADLAAGRVVVHIDPAQRDWYLIVVAETVYTFSELGIDRVDFPGLTDGPVGRADVPFMAFVLNAPMWRALPGRPVAAGMIVLPNGDQVAAGEFYDRWSEGDRVLRTQLLSYLESGSSVEQIGVLAILGQEPVEGGLDAVMGLLDDTTEQVRVQAVIFLAASGEPRAMERLTEVLSSDESAAVRSAAADALGNTGDDRFRFFELEHRLAEAAGGDVAPALSAVLETGDPRAIAVAERYLEDADETVRGTAMAGLVSLGGTQQLVDRLDGELPLFIRLQIAEVLITTTDGETKVRALESLVAAREGQIALDHLSRLLDEGGSPGQGDVVRQALERQLGHASQEIRVAVADALGRRGEAESLQALADASGREANSDVTAAFDASAIELMSHLAPSDVERHAGGRNVFLKRAAYVALGEFAQQGRGSQSTFRTLSDGLSATTPEIRGAAVLGLATYANGEAFASIAPLATDSDASVRRDVAQALGRFPVGQGSDLLRAFLEDSEDDVIAAALVSVGQRGEGDLLETVMGMTQSGSPRIRAGAARALSGLSYEEIERGVIETLLSATSDDDDEVRIAAAEALSSFGSEMAVLGISQLTQDRNGEVRLRAIAALSQVQDRSAVGVLVSLLEDPQVDIRLAAVRALGELGMADAVPQIMAALADEQDPGVLDAAQDVVNALQNR